MPLKCVSYPAADAYCRRYWGYYQGDRIDSKTMAFFKVCWGVGVGMV